MSNKNIGQLEPTSVRTVWPDEALDFTPWLARNLDLLGEAVGVELSLIETESYGWSGSLDILAETPDRVRVAIENQLEPSDSDHFARLIGYAANHDSRILIWVAPRFYNYHLRILSWLNSAMADNTKIYAVAVRLEPDGDLLPTGGDGKSLGFKAVFEAIESHVDWSSPPVLTGEERENLPHKRRLFFQRLLGDLRHEGFTDRTTPRAGRSQSFPSGHTGIAYNAGFEWSRPFVFLSISVGNRAESARIFDALSEYRAELERELLDLQFDVIGQHGGWRKTSVGMTRDGHIGDPDETLDEIRAWMSDRIIRLKDAVEPLLKKVMGQFQSEGSYRDYPNTGTLEP